MQHALSQWHTPQAAERIAEVMLVALGAQARKRKLAEPSWAAPLDPPTVGPRNGGKPSSLLRASGSQLGATIPKRGNNSAYGGEAQVTA